MSQHRSSQIGKPIETRNSGAPDLRPPTYQCVEVTLDLCRRSANPEHNQELSLMHPPNNLQSRLAILPPPTPQLRHGAHDLAGVISCQ